MELRRTAAWSSSLRPAHGVGSRCSLPKEIVIIAPRSRQEAEPFLARLRSSYVPNRILAVAVEGKDLETQGELVYLLRGKVAHGGKSTAYVCERGVCKLPTGDPDAFAHQIHSVFPLGQTGKRASPGE